MALAIRLSRGGRKARPFYRIVVADKRSPRDGRYIEKLGTYNPLLDDNAKRVELVEERVQYWLSQGAQPTERVAIFLGKAGLIDMPEQPNRPKKSAQSEKTKMKIADKQEKLKAAEEAKAAAAEEAKAAAEAEKAAEAEAEAQAAPVDASQTNKEENSDAPVESAAQDEPTAEASEDKAEAIEETGKPAEGIPADQTPSDETPANPSATTGDESQASDVKEGPDAKEVAQATNEAEEKAEEEKKEE